MFYPSNGLSYYHLYRLYLEFTYQNITLDAQVNHFGGVTNDFFDGFGEADENIIKSLGAAILNNIPTGSAIKDTGIGNGPIFHGIFGGNIKQIDNDDSSESEDISNLSNGGSLPQQTLIAISTVKLSDNATGVKQLGIIVPISVKANSTSISNTAANGVVLVSLLLTLNTFHTLF